MRSVAVIAAAILASLEPEYSEHVVPSRRLVANPDRRPQRAEREDRARRRTVADLESLACAEEVRRVLADDVTAAHRLHADLTRRTRPDLTVARVTLDLVVVAAVTRRDRPRDHERCPR